MHNSTWYFRDTDIGLDLIRLQFLLITSYCDGGLDAWTWISSVATKATAGYYLSLNSLHFLRKKITFLHHVS